MLGEHDEGSTCAYALDEFVDVDVDAGRTREAVSSWCRAKPNDR